MKLPIRPLGLVAAGLLLGTLLAPVAAQQQQSGVDGQVAVRSDKAVYLIANGQRRWVATVVISDDEINAYPQGEPIYAGLAPLGSAQVASNPQPKPNSNQQAGNTNNSNSNNSQPKPTNNNQAAAPPADPNLSTDLPVKVDIHDSEQIEQGETRQVDIKTRKDVTCELTVRLPSGKELVEDSKNADGQGKCRFNIEIPDDADEGEGMMIGTVRDGGKMNTHELPFEVVEK